MSDGAPPVIVAGMHRSGTSLVGSWLAALGVELGDDLIAADRRNAKGYYEDRAFVRLHGRMLAAATRGGGAGHRDWGFTTAGRFERRALARFDGAARALLAARRRPDRPWGWKDPRTTLLLDFWAERLPDACFILPYRLPWAVADSLQRIGEDVFLDHPDWSLAAWELYNRHVLDFRLRHANDALLVSADAMTADPGAFVTALRDRLGLPLAGSVDGLFDGALFCASAPDDPARALLAQERPGCIELLDRLDAAADLPNARPAPAVVRPPAAPRVTVRVLPVRGATSLGVETRASVARAAAASAAPVAPAAAADTPYVLDLVAGDRLLPGWLAAATAHLDRHPQVAAVCGLVRRYGAVRDVAPIAQDGAMGAVRRAGTEVNGPCDRLAVPAIEHRVTASSRGLLERALRRFSR